MSDNTTKLSFWGVRGSIPSIERSTCRYGGNTPCLELLTSGGGRFILDCGTGLRMLGNRWAAESGEKSIDADVFVTHFHWDHIQGIPFFTPLYSAQNKFRFYSFRSEFVGPGSLQRVFEAQMARPYFPVNLNELSSKRDFNELTGGDKFAIRDTRVTARWLNHPQGCLGFRFDTPAGTIVYATDNEPGAAEYDRELLELADGADVLICDAQYTPLQLQTRRGWGHSSWLEGVRTAQAAGVKHLVLFHHDPDSSDISVDSILREARDNFENVWVAAEGMIVSLDEKQVNVAIPPECATLGREAEFRAHVTGTAQDGSTFEEHALISDLGLRAARTHLRHTPKIQSELQVTFENSANGTGGKHGPISGYVVSMERTEDDRVGVQLVFTE